MSEDPTFSIVARSFPAGADDRRLRAALALACGITEPEAQDLIGSAPVVVKSGVDVPTTKRLASTLIKLGIEVILRNELTGEERVQRGTGAHPAAASVPPPPPPPPPPAAESAAVAPAVVEPSAAVPSVATAPVGFTAGDDLAPSVSPVELCASCARNVEKGEVCTHCGWHNDDKKRYCTQCQKNVAPGIDVPGAKKLLVALIVIGGAAAAVGAFLYFGVYVAAAAGGLAVGLAWLTASLGGAYRCVACSKKVEPYLLRSDETKVLAKLRRRGIVLGAVFSVVGLGLVVPALLSDTPPMFIDSFGIGWRAAAPVTHRDAERRVLMIPMDFGPQRLTMLRRSHARMSMRSYVLLHSLMSENAKLAADDARLEAFMKKVVEAGLGGTLAATEVVTVGDRKARQGSFQATDGGAKVAGKIRAIPFDRDVVMIAFVSAGEAGAADPAGLAFLDSLLTVKP